MKLAREALRKKEEYIQQQSQLTAQAAAMVEQEKLALQAAANEIAHGILTSELSYLTSVLDPPKKRVKRKGAIYEDGDEFIGNVTIDDGSIN